MTPRERRYHRRKMELKRGVFSWAHVSQGQHGKCDHCGKATDFLTECHLSIVVDVYERLCPKCMIGSGYCLVCGQYWAGCEEFDFNPVGEYCPNCTDEIRSTFGEDSDDDWGYDDYWDDDDPDDDPDSDPEWEPDPDFEQEIFEEEMAEMETY